jgi:hypothetical protein
MCFRTSDIAVSVVRNSLSSVQMPEVILGLEIGHAKGVSWFSLAHPEQRKGLKLNKTGHGIFYTIFEKLIILPLTLE